MTHLITERLLIIKKKIVLLAKIGFMLCQSIGNELITKSRHVLISNGHVTYYFIFESFEVTTDKSKNKK